MEPQIYDPRENKEQFCTVAQKHTRTQSCVCARTLLHRREVSLCLRQCPETFKYRDILNVIIIVIIINNNNNILMYAGQYTLDRLYVCV